MGNIVGSAGKALCAVAWLALVPTSPVEAGPCDAHFRFDGDLSDAGGGGLHGQLIVAGGEPATTLPRFERGKFGQALRLDGETVMYSPLDLQTETCPKVTIAAWIYAENHATLGTLVSTGHGRGPRLDIGDAYVRSFAGSGGIRADSAVRRGQWIFVAGTWDYEARLTRLYWRTRWEEAAITEQQRPPQEGFWVGGNAYFKSLHYIADGLLVDELRVWGRVLDEDELREVQAAGNPALTACDCDGGRGVCDAHYTFDGNVKDASGNAFHGLRIDRDNVPLGGGDFQQGRFGQALHMDGSAAVVTPLDLHWDFCSQVTIALWVRRNAQPAQLSYLVSSGNGSGPKLGVSENRIDIEGGASAGNMQFSIEPGVWTPLVGTWDFEADEMTLHWPGGSLTKPFREYTLPPQPEFWIGANGYFSSLIHVATGMLLDDVRVWGRILSSQEIAALQAGNPPEVARCVCGSDTGAPPFPLLDPPPTRPDPHAVDPDLTPMGDLPEVPPAEGDFEHYQEQVKEEYEQNFGPRDRAQVVISRSSDVAYVSVPEAFVPARGRIAALDTELQRWLAGGKKIREIFRINGTEAIVAVADDGTVAVEGDAQGKDRPVVARIAEIRGRGRPIDLVADQLGDYIVISGTNVYSHQAPPGAVAWAQQELSAGLQVTALALLNSDAWVGVSQRGAASGGMPAGHWGHELLADVQRLVDAGEVVQDISAPISSQAERWAIATDKRIFIRGFPDCNTYTSFGARVESELSRSWECEVWQRHCLANRATWDENDMGSGSDPSVWQVNLLVTIGIADYDGQDKENFDCWLEQSLRRTELLFNDPPRLELRLRTQRLTRVDGVDLPKFVMESDKDYAKFMDRNFDTMAKTRTEGYYPVLMVNDICIGYEPGGARHCIGGRATFPHVVDPLTRKHGIILTYPDSRDWVLAHEFGHYLGIPHTFQTSGTAALLRCNDIYPVAAKCNSCQGSVDAAGENCDATYNVMDYCSGDNDDVRLNACQREKSARQRERYLTNDGETDYFKMKGRLGEPYCANDGECLDDEYCNTGVATVGRNVCKPKLSDGATCSRGGQCESGNCSLFTCK